MSERGIPFASQPGLIIYYKGKPLKKLYSPDLIVFGKIVVEIKALDQITPREEAQLLNYLKATGMKVGLLINFGDRKRLIWKRMVLTR